MIRSKKYEDNLFEQILRIKSLIKESNGYGDLIMEGPITGIFKSVVKSLDELVKAGKISDTLLADAARAVGKMTDESTALMKFQTFYKKAIDSGNGAVLGELADETLKVLPPDTAKNIDDLEKAFVDSAVAEGKVTTNSLANLSTTIKANLKLTDSLKELQGVLEAKLLARFKNAAEKALDVGATVAGKTSNILDTTFDDVVKQVNDALKNEVPPKKISREILEKAEKSVDDIETAFKNGEITQEELYDYLIKQAVENKSNIDKFKEILPKYSGLISTIYDLITSGIAKFWAGIGKIVTWKNLKIFLMACVTGYAVTGLYKGEYNPWNWWGVGKAQKCFGDDKMVECVNSIPGYSTLDSTQVGLLCNLQEIPQNEGVGRLGCDNINELAKPEVKVKSITFKGADGVGKVDKFEITFGDGKTKIYDAKTGKEIGGGGTVVPPVPVVPPPGACVWTTEEAAKNAVKGGVKLPAGQSVNDADITVDLAACSVTYKHPILGVKSYTPASFE